MSAQPHCFAPSVSNGTNQILSVPESLRWYLRYFGHDTAYAAAFLIYNIPLLTKLDVLSYWTFSDIFEEVLCLHLLFCVRTRECCCACVCGVTPWVRFVYCACAIRWHS